MRAQTFALALSALLCAGPPASDAAQAGALHRIGVLESVDAAENAENLDAFRRGLTELGNVEGTHFALEYRSADGRAERFRDLALELVGLNVDVIVTRGTPAALAAKHAAGTTPIVMVSSGDPVVAGLVTSLDQPGANITGFHMIPPPELGGKRLQLLREAAPGSARIGILWNSADIQSPLIVRETERVARAMGIQLKSLELQRPWPSMPVPAFDQVFEAALLDQVDALIAVEDAVMIRDRARVVGFAAMSRLPAIYGLREFVDAGGLMSYGADRRDLFYRSAAYVHKILHGVRPAELAVKPPTKFELAINLKTARTLGLTLPPSLLQRADYVVR